MAWNAFKVPQLDRSILLRSIALRAGTFVAAASLASCFHSDETRSSNWPNPNNRDNPQTSNSPPCALPSLSEKEILDVARRALGDEAFQPKGLPPPNRRIDPDACRYVYVQSIFYNGGEPASLDDIDSTTTIYIARDKTFKRP
jgi:hypothetical protein